MSYLWHRYQCRKIAACMPKERISPKQYHYYYAVKHLESIKEYIENIQNTSSASQPFRYKWYKLKVVISFVKCSNGRNLMFCLFIQSWCLMKSLSTAPSPISILKKISDYICGGERANTFSNEHYLQFDSDKEKSREPISFGVILSHFSTAPLWSIAGIHLCLRKFPVLTTNHL